MMKGITLCGECGSYDWKKHRCRRGAMKDTTPPGGFYADCPLEDVEPVRHGRWVQVRSNFRCASCGKECKIVPGADPAYLYNYCPNCGAWMWTSGEAAE